VLLAGKDIIIQHLYSALKSCKGYGGAGVAEVRAVSKIQIQNQTRMWVDAQRDGRPAEYRWRPLRKFRNSIPCTTPQSLADARCWSAVQ